MTLTDRSRIIAAQTCPRKRFLEYHWGGTGLQRKAKALPLQFGSAFHEGCPDLLAGDVETAVYRALKYLNDQFQAHAVGFDGEEPADVAAAAQYGREEQCALAEALLRGWWAWEGERFLRDFEVLEVEKEGRANLTDPTKWEFKQPYGSKYGSVAESDALTLMFRPDALVRERETGDLYILSWKTCSYFSKRTTDQAKTDMQSMSEAWGLEQTRGETIEGILYKFVCKGQRRKDSWDGLYKQGSHLVYGWCKTSGDDVDWSWAYEFPNEENPERTSKLGKGWAKKAIWRDYPGGVKAWVEGLSRNEIFPRHKNALEQVFPQAMPVERRADEIEHWKAQVVAQEQRVATHLQYLATDSEEILTQQLDQMFPQYTHSCSNYGSCPMNDVCWNPEIGRDPLGSGLYIPRLSNHPESGDSDE